MTTIGMLAVDLSKGSFQVCAVGPDGTILYNRALSRSRSVALLADQPACVVAMEACATSHHWGRVAQKSGHEVRLLWGGGPRLRDDDPQEPGDDGGPGVRAGLVAIGWSDGTICISPIARSATGFLSVISERRVDPSRARKWVKAVEGTCPSLPACKQCLAFDRGAIGK